MPPRIIRRLILIAALLRLAGLPVQAARVPLRSVEATYQNGSDAALQQVINGRDAAKTGWSAAPHVSGPQAIIFHTAAPVQALAFNLTFCFLSGEVGRYCDNMVLSYSTDRDPALGSEWHRLTVDRMASIGPNLHQTDDGMIHSDPPDSMIGDAVFEFRVNSPHQAITAFRLDVFPYWDLANRQWQLGRSGNGDFCLTQFRVDSIESTTTNLALGCTVKASDRLWADISPSVLTDGLPGSYAHPARADVGRSFYFEIDLGSVRQIDHFGLRGRSDGLCLDRMSKLALDFFDEAPASGGAPTWQARDRADGSYPAAGEVDIIHAANGRGACHGRYLRISTESGVALSPQLAEVEAYGKLTPKFTAIRADGRPVSLGSQLSLPAGAETLSFSMVITGDGAIDRLPVRWRLRGYHDDWQITRNLTGEVARLRPGKYVLEAHAGHSDGEWDASTVSLALFAPAPFWRTPLFLWSVAGSLAAIAAFSVREVTRRRHAAKIAALEYSSALANERTRIARDMHDEVGARLSQLAVMQDLALHQTVLPAEAQARFQRISDIARLAVAALDEVVWAVAPHNDTLPALVAYLGVCASNYLEPLEIAYRVDAPLDWPPLEIRAQVRHELAMAFKEALQNVAKHSSATEVTLTLRRSPNQLTVLLADNGSGLPNDPPPGRRNGIPNMQARLASAGGECAVRNRAAGGVEVEMRIPLPNPI